MKSKKPKQTIDPSIAIEAMNRLKNAAETYILENETESERKRKTLTTPNGLSIVKFNEHIELNAFDSIRNIGRMACDVYLRVDFWPHSEMPDVNEDWYIGLSIQSQNVPRRDFPKVAEAFINKF